MEFKTKILSVKDVANQLKVSEQHVRSMLRKKQINSIRVGKQWLVEKSEFDKYLKRNRSEIEPDDHKSRIKVIPKIKALSFFSGALGLDIGMENAGINPMLVCESDKSCRKTINSNKPELALIGDIWKYDAKSIIKMSGLNSFSEVDVIFGGPPCQAFSTAGSRKGFTDIRGNVFLKFIDIISEIKPKYVVIENVRGLLSAPLNHVPHHKRKSTNFVLTESELPGGALLHILNKLRSIGYSISFNLYSAANYGAPQVRERVVIICYLGKGKVPYLTPTHSENGEHGLQPWVTLSEALLKIKNIEHHYVKFPESRLVYFRMLKEGQNWRNLPKGLQKEALGNSYYAGGGKTGFLRRLSLGKPSPTLVTHPAMPATDLAHPTEDRPLSIEEYKCIQGFPMDWELSGTLINQYRQVGNAVPIKLGEAIGKAIIDHVNGIIHENIPNFRYSRYVATDEVSWENNVRRELSKIKANEQRIPLFV